MMKNTCEWAVVATCTAKNNGVNEEFQKIIATFEYPFLANDYIEKCLPIENRNNFEIVAL